MYEKKFGLYWDRDTSKENFIDLHKNKIPILRKKREIVKSRNNLNHILIEGDNFHTLTLLNMLYENKGFVDVIYIDPPYNTGNKDFKYNDKFIDNEDGFKHSKWLSFMEKRLILAKDILKNNGSIFISIDDREVANLKLLCDKIFGEKSFISLVPRLSSPQRSGQENHINVSHDYILIYSYSEDFNHITTRNIDKPILSDKNGKYIEGDTKAILAAKSQGYSEGGDYDFEFNGKIYSPIDKNGARNRWLWVEERMKKAKELGILVESGNTLRTQLYLDVKFEVKTNLMVPKQSLLRFHTADFMTDNIYSNPNGTRSLERLIGPNDFNNPKPVELIKQLVRLHPVDGEQSIVLDFFAGSGTLGQAVMELNEEGGNYKFILGTNNEVSREDSINYLVVNKFINKAPTNKRKKDYKDWCLSTDLFRKSEEYLDITNKFDYKLLGICESITFPRLSNFINGIDYLGNKISDGVNDNLQYLYIDFIEKTSSDNQNKYTWVEFSSEMLNLIEETHNTLFLNSKYYISQNNDQSKLMGVYTDFYEKKSFNEFIEKINNIETDVKVVYIFSIDNVINLDLKQDDIIIKTIPNRIYEIYKDIMKGLENRNED